jgi:hypothetical protein
MKGVKVKNNGLPEYCSIMVPNQEMVATLWGYQCFLADHLRLCLARIVMMHYHQTLQFC